MARSKSGWFRRQIKTSGIIVSLLCPAVPLASSAGPGTGTDENGLFPVGFRLVQEFDVTRNVPGSKDPERAFPRPIRIYTWYPADRNGNGREMPFARYAAMADEDIWPSELSGNLRKELKYSKSALARSLTEAQFASLLDQKTMAVEEATALPGPFPLIVLGQGQYYESPIVFSDLAESLAARGFVVATSPLAGTGSPIVRADAVDLETYVRDLEFVVAATRRLPFVNRHLLGVLGFDMGGMAGLILTMRNPDVDVFVSMSSDVFYPDPERIPANSPHYDPSALRVPWLHSMPSYWLSPPGAGKVSLFDTARHSDRYLLLTNGFGHVDYTSYALIPGRSEMGGYWAEASPEVAGNYRLIRRYVQHFLSAFLQGDPESQAIFTVDPDTELPGSVMAIQRRPAEPVEMTYATLVRSLVAGNGEHAISALRALRAADPGHWLTRKSTLERIVWSLRDTWGYTREVSPLIRLMDEWYPKPPTGSEPDP